MQIEIKPNALDCPLRLCFECGMRERECKDCIPGVYELIPAGDVEKMRAEIERLKVIEDKWKLVPYVGRVAADYAWANKQRIEQDGDNLKQVGG